MSWWHYKSAIKVRSFGDHMAWCVAKNPWSSKSYQRIKDTNALNKLTYHSIHVKIHNWLKFQTNWSTIAQLIDVSKIQKPKLASETHDLISPPGLPAFLDLILTGAATDCSYLDSNLVTAHWEKDVNYRSSTLQKVLWTKTFPWTPFRFQAMLTTWRQSMRIKLLRKLLKILIDLYI